MFPENPLNVPLNDAIQFANIIPIFPFPILFQEFFMSCFLKCASCCRNICGSMKFIGRGVKCTVYVARYVDKMAVTVPRRSVLISGRTRPFESIAPTAKKVKSKLKFCFFLIYATGGVTGRLLSQSHRPVSHSQSINFNGNGGSGGI